MNPPHVSAEILALLRAGQVIPAHPLALDAAGRFDERHQRALTRYYCAAGARGIAVGVHTTQFAIRDTKHGLFQPVIEMAGGEVDNYVATHGRPVVKIGGICGETPQAVTEAAILRDCGYHVGLLSLAALRDASVGALVEHCRAVAEVIPIMGFYLQPAVGGRILPVTFWRRFVELENVCAVKIAPFNRYQTLDVVRAVAEAGRAQNIALYTGNDDSIVADLLTSYRIATGSGPVSVRMVGGLLGHWACWTRSAVALLNECHRIVASRQDVPYEILTRAVEVTDANGALFDAANGFAGCIAGIHAVLVRQGLLASTRCLNPTETLSPGQQQEIDRVYVAYPHLNDDAFVAEYLDQWLA